MYWANLKTSPKYWNLVEINVKVCTVQGRLWCTGTRHTILYCTMSIQYICSTLATIESGNRETTIEYLYKVQATKDYMVYSGLAQLLIARFLHCTAATLLYTVQGTTGTAASARCTEEVYYTAQLQQPGVQMRCTK